MRAKGPKSSIQIEDVEGGKDVEDAAVWLALVPLVCPVKKSKGAPCLARVWTAGWVLLPVCIWCVAASKTGRSAHLTDEDKLSKG